MRRARRWPGAGDDRRTWTRGAGTGVESARRLTGDTPIKPLFINTPSPTARFAACAILSFLCISIDHANTHLSSLRSALSVVVYPLQYVVNAPVQAAADVMDDLRSRQALVEENARLHAENALLSVKSQRYSALESENQRLRKLLDSSSAFEQQVVVADVLAIETAPSARQIVLDKGSNQGVFVGQPMLDAYGVIGQVSNVSMFSSTGLLITDQRHALPVLLNRTGLRAIAVGGDLPDELNLSFISINADIKEGDLVVTSGLGGRFPAGYPVGRVKAVSVKPGDAFSTIVVEPTAKVGHSREVMLVGPQTHDIGQERISASE
ncbi:MAG: rod shape-determining protein MreC [Proteobacteria bacterium]|nr:rod shape-determining protein MreC [Pseudomonadota bacterium]MBK8960182.1 rod shape-determining protein MreC [Pseudomonadota bacterium]